MLLQDQTGAQDHVKGSRGNNTSLYPLSSHDQELHIKKVFVQILAEHKYHCLPSEPDHMGAVAAETLTRSINLGVTALKKSQGIQRTTTQTL